jgi:DNA mismatch repair protein MutS
MLRQYLDAKERHPGTLLFFRMGDFYELFFEDATIASEVLEITLTSRGTKGSPDAYPMAGVPHHAAGRYIQKLVAAGHRVAICEQVQDPAKAKGLVDRKVVRVVTPGVFLEADAIDSRRSNFLAAVAAMKNPEGPFGVALCEVSTGQLIVTEVQDQSSLLHELLRAQVAEVLVSEDLTGVSERLETDTTIHVTNVPRRSFQPTTLSRLLRDQLAANPDRKYRSAVMAPDAAVGLLDAVIGLGLRHESAVKEALVGLLHYVARVQLGIPVHITTPSAKLPSDYVALDSASEANLEIFQSLIGGVRAGSLLSVLDKTVTAVGGRLLKSVLSHPLVDRLRIEGRLSAVEALTRSERRRGQIRELLKKVGDIPRLTSRVVSGAANARDLIALAGSLNQIPQILALAEKDDPERLRSVFDQMDPCSDLAQLLAESLVDDPPVSTSEGGMFRRGHDDELDELIKLSRSGNEWLLEYEQKQRQESGIDSLKLRFNRVFGYYLEVTRSNLHKVPEHYIRKQTLASGERYFTLELKEHEDKILGAKERRAKLEIELLSELVGQIIDAAHRLHQTSGRVAELDLFGTFAELAVKNRYVRPIMDDGRVTDIEEGRHPVVELTTAGERFVPNSIRLDVEAEQLTIVTGPNMAGKSTIIRQVALITLMGQIGCFVPARSATLGIVDQIFSRVGASDNLARGQSTFMVEMTETAHILLHATDRSLIVLDEIGRGTSTYDGLSIAWAVAENIVDVIGARTLFATHYHELTELAKTRDRVRNVSVAVKEWNDDIVFLRRLVNGSANKSYGIQVGRLAGLPRSVIDRAKQVLVNLESTAYTNGGTPTVSIDPKRPAPPAPQLDLFARTGVLAAVPAGIAEVLAALDEVDTDVLTPIEALNLVFAMKQNLET